MIRSKIIYLASALFLTAILPAHAEGPDEQALDKSLAEMQSQGYGDTQYRPPAVSAPNAQMMPLDPATPTVTALPPLPPASPQPPAPAQPGDAEVRRLNGGY